MKNSITYNIGEFTVLDPNKDDSLKPLTDKLYKYIFIDSHGKISMIKAIEKYSNNNNGEILFNKFETNKNELEKNIKVFNGMIIVYNSIENEIFLNLYEYFQKIEKNLIKEKYFPKIIIGDKQDYINSFNINLKDKKNSNKLKNIKFIEPSLDTNETIKKAVEEIIKIKKIKEAYDHFINRNVINDKCIINTFIKSKINLLKCFNCNQIYEISIINNSKNIKIYCSKCDFTLNVDIMDFDKFINDINCFECRRKKSENNQINYCFLCKKNICDECSKNHLHKEDKDYIKCNNNIYPNNLIDLFCNKHYKICYNYCLKCKKNICPECEIEFHINHSTKIFEYNKICKLISKKKKKLIIEKEKFKKIKNIVEDCINSLKKYFNKLILNKEKEIYYKEKIIQELEIFKLDNTLIENTNNLKFTKYELSIYNNKDSWDKKLSNIFDYFNEPIKIEEVKLSLKENLIGPFDILQNIEETLHGTSVNFEKVTDLCPLHYYKGNYHFAVSFNNGLLKIYNDDFDNRIPINIIKIFEDSEGIISLQKSSGNSLLLIGVSKIKRINLSQNLLDYKIINEIDLKDQLFKLAIENDLFNGLIWINNLNEIVFYDYFKQITSSISKNKDIEDGKEISFMYNISHNKMILQFNNSNNLIELKAEAGSLTINCDEKFNNNNNNNIDSTSSLLLINNSLNPEESSNIYWKIIEIEKNEDKIEINKSYKFKSDIYYLGKMSEQIILLFNKTLKKMILFNILVYSNDLEISFKYTHNPLSAFYLNKRNDFYDLLLIKEEGIISQYSLNSKLGIIHEIDKNKIIENDNKTLIETKKENGFKNSIVKTINLTKNCFLFFSKGNYIYKLKNSS